MNLFTYSAPTDDESVKPATLSIDVDETGDVVLTARRQGSGKAEPAKLLLPRRQIRALNRVFKSLALDQPILPDGPEAED